MHKSSGRMLLKDLNQHLICFLCGGYFIDVTTIVECLHSFCHSCLIKYLQNNNYCPICEVQIHKVQPYLNIKPDKTLQDIVYKLVPGLFQAEMRRRREFYAKYPERWALVTPEERGVPNDRIIYSADDRISLSLEYSEPAASRQPIASTSRGTGNIHDAIHKNNKRYLQCPSMVTVGHLKKFVRMKYDLTSKHIIEILHHTETLSEEYTMMDIAYIFMWKRKHPLRLFYRILYSTELINESRTFAPAAARTSLAQQLEIRSNLNSLTNSNAYKLMEEAAVPRKRKDTRPLKNRNYIQNYKKQDGIKMILKQEDVAVSSKQDNGDTSGGEHSRSDISMKVWKVSSLTEPVVPTHSSTVSRNFTDSVTITPVTKAETNSLVPSTSNSNGGGSSRSFNTKDTGPSCVVPLVTKNKDLSSAGHGHSSSMQGCINNNSVKFDKYLNDVKGVFINKSQVSQNKNQSSQNKNQVSQNKNQISQNKSQVSQFPLKNNNTHSEHSSNATPIVQKLPATENVQQSASSSRDCIPLDMRLGER